MQTLKTKISALKNSGSESPKLDAELLLSHVLGCTRLELKTRDVVLNAAQEKQFNSLLSRRLNREPLAYILGLKEFWSMDFAVSPAVLCPRPDTEILVQTALSLRHSATSPHILDLGTGSGAILLSLLAELPHATGIGIDISLQALEMARKNAVDLGLASRADFLLGSWCDGLSDSFDLIVSNPPYIESSVISGLAPEVAKFEPKLALDGGMDGLDAYRVLIPQLQKHLRLSGWVVLEVGEGQAFAVQQLMSEQKLDHFSIIKDTQGIDRCVIAQRI